MAVILRKIGREATIVTVGGANTVILRLRGTQGPGTVEGSAWSCRQ